MYNLKPCTIPAHEQASEVARFKAHMDAEEARKSPEALCAYLSEHFPAAWTAIESPQHRPLNAVSAEIRLGKIRVQATFFPGGCAVDLYPNVMPQRRSVHSVEFAQELGYAVKVAARSQNPEPALPKWAI